MSRVSLRIPQSLREWLEQQADSEHRNLNEQVTHLLEGMRSGKYVERRSPAS